MYNFFFQCSCTSAQIFQFSNFPLYIHTDPHVIFYLQIFLVCTISSHSEDMILFTKIIISIFPGYVFLKLNTVHINYNFEE